MKSYTYTDSDNILNKITSLKHQLLNHIPLHSDIFKFKRIIKSIKELGRIGIILTINYEDDDIVSIL